MKPATNPLSEMAMKRNFSSDMSSLYDRQQVSSSNVKVVVRVRPENEKEAGSRVVTQVVNENELVFDPQENSYGKRPRYTRKTENVAFQFDSVYGPDSTTSDVYETTTKSSILTSLLNGYNCSVFAYGTSGSGKSHTMMGTSDAPGVICLAVNDLFQRFEASDLSFSYLEIYNETIRDLLAPTRDRLAPSRCLQIQQDSTGVVIPGLSKHKAKTAKELLNLLTVGNQQRTESSRSHAVFQVFIQQKGKTSLLNMVDLAGSEKVTVTNRGSRSINRSLLALGNVINALGEKKIGYIPYRDSKLTQLLKDSLGGNCQTVMIATVSPSSCSMEDTHNTLRYADRAKKIKFTLKKSLCIEAEDIMDKIKESDKSNLKELASMEGRDVPVQEEGTEIQRENETLKQELQEALKDKEGLKHQVQKCNQEIKRLEDLMASKEQETYDLQMECNQMKVQIILKDFLLRRFRGMCERKDDVSQLPCQEQGTEIQMLEEQGTEVQMLEEQGTEIQMLEEQGTEIQMLEEQGTEIQMLEEQGTEIQMLEEQGTEVQMLQEQGTEIQMLQEQGTDIQMLEEQGTEIPMLTEQGTEIQMLKDSLSLNESKMELTSIETCQKHLKENNVSFYELAGLENKDTQELFQWTHNPQLVGEYADFMYEYRRGLEQKYTVKEKYLDGSDIMGEIRDIIVEQLFKCHQSFNMNDATLFAAISIMDRFLQIKPVTVNKLQLVGATSMYIAAKNEEVHSPGIKYFVNLVYAEEEILEKYTKDDIKEMERIILSTLKFDVGNISCLDFLERNCQAGKVDINKHKLAKYLMRLTVKEYDMVQYLPSHIAAGALCLSMKLLDKSKWTDTLTQYSGYTEMELIPLMDKLASLVVKDVDELDLQTPRKSRPDDTETTLLDPSHTT